MVIIPSFNQLSIDYIDDYLLEAFDFNLSFNSYSPALIALAKNDGFRFIIKFSNPSVKGSLDSILYEHQILKIVQSIDKGINMLIEFKETKLIIDNNFYKVNYLIKEYLPTNFKDSIQNIKQLKKFIVEIINVLEAIHLEGLIYNDLKPDNIRFNKTQNEFQLIDFGNSIKIGKVIKNSRVNRSIYFCIDKVKNMRYGFYADWYALSVILHEIVFGQDYFISLLKHREFKKIKPLEGYNNKILLSIISDLLHSKNISEQQLLKSIKHKTSLL